MHYAQGMYLDTNLFKVSGVCLCTFKIDIFFLQDQFIKFNFSQDLFGKPLNDLVMRCVIE